MASLAQPPFWEEGENDLGNHGVQYFFYLLFSMSEKIRRVFPTIIGGKKGLNLIELS